MSQAMQLALRQNEILRQLSDLKEQMSDLRKSLKIGSKVLTSKSNGKIEVIFKNQVLMHLKNKLR